MCWLALNIGAYKLYIYIYMISYLWCDKIWAHFWYIDIIAKVLINKICKRHININSFQYVKLPTQLFFTTVIQCHTTQKSRSIWISELYFFQND